MWLLGSQKLALGLIQPQAWLEQLRAGTGQSYSLSFH